MARIIEGTPGTEAEVWIQDKGAAKAELRGTIVIEDLSDVLTSISSKTGANGPNNPVTQYILAEAAEYLAERLIEDASGGQSGRDAVPRTLSGALGHQPFIESVLNMSQHQMLRRWPLATDWYQDVVNYIMRPSRFMRATRSVEKRFDEWASGPLGELIRQFSETVFRWDGDPQVLRMAEALQALWPDYPPVRNASVAYHEQIQVMWMPFYEEALRRYGLVMQRGFTLQDIGWVFNALQTRETWERLAGFDTLAAAPDGRGWSMTARTSLMALAGAVEGVDGTRYSASELADLLPLSDR